METLRTYINSLSRDDQVAYAERCGTTIGSLRTALAKKSKPDVRLVADLVRWSGGKVKARDLRPDVDWDVFSKA